MVDDPDEMVDELHLSVGGGFWVEWFPCDQPPVERAFVDAVLGLISGRYRIVEIRQRGEPVWARLERPEGGRWKRVATWQRTHLPLPWWRTKNVLLNAPSIAG
jgi:hypothetical protein